MAKQRTKTSPAPQKASARKAATAKKAPALDLTPVETIRIPPEDAPSLEALRLFMKAYEKL
jgi:hypothetical protein